MIGRRSPTVKGHLNRAEGTMASATRAKVPGIVEKGGVYTLIEFQRRTGCGRWSLKKMRQAGLQVRYFGGRAFIRAEDFDAFLAKTAETQHFNAPAQDSKNA